MKWISFTFVALFVIKEAQALSAARLLGQSSSGHTVLFNLGVHDGVREGDFAVIVKEIRDLSTRDLRLIPVAKAKNIKLSSRDSVWILYKIYDSELFVKGERYLVLSESSMLSGRKDPRFARISVVTEKDKAAFQARKAMDDDHDRLARLKKVYPEIETMHEREQRSDQDGELIDLESWKRFNGNKYRTALYKSPSQKEFKRRLKLETFEKMVTAYLKKVNDPAFNYDKFYDEQMKTEFHNEFRKKTNFQTEYEQFLSNQAQKAVADAKLYRSILEKGESWSENFSDEELRSVLTSVSVLQEKDRREFVVAKPTRYAAFLGYAIGLGDNQTEQDTGFRRDHLYSVEFDFEGVPFLKHETLEHFSLNATVRLNKTAFEESNQNVSFDDTSFTFGVNWYPLYAPYVVESPVIFFGMYFRSGWGQATAPTVNEKANYTLFAAPGFRAGMRYNFKNNVGIRLSGSMETLRLDGYEQSTLTGILPAQKDLPDAKLQLAMAYSF